MKKNNLSLQEKLKDMIQSGVEVLISGDTHPLDSVSARVSGSTPNSQYIQDSNLSLG